MTTLRRSAPLLLVLAGCRSSDALWLDSTGGDTGWKSLPREATSVVGTPTTLSTTVQVMGASTCDINGDGYDDAYLDGTTSSDMIAYGSASGLGTPSSFTATSSLFAACVGDVTGDGYDDVMAADYTWDRYGTISGTTGNEGFVSYFAGSAAGLNTSAYATTPGSGRDYQLGSMPKSVGDIDGDGERDWAYGILGYDGGETNEGAVIVGYSNLATSTAVDADVASAGIGSCFGSAGDVNGDGYGDLLVCTRSDYTDTVGTGNLRIFYGSASGVDTTAAWVGSATIYFSSGGHVDLFGAGDLDGDGYDDLIVGEYANADYLIWYGSGAGLTTSPNQTIAPATVYDFPHVEVADFDQDGYADAALTAGFASNCTNRGSVYIHRGSASGLSTSADTTLVSGSDYAADETTHGDYDGDGAEDLLLPVARTTCLTSLTTRVFYGEGIDSDGDGSFDADDCEPGDPAVSPITPESCDSVDSDCDGDFADGFTDTDSDGTPDCVDSDADADGDPASADCDDTDARISHRATETVDDGIDQDCSGGDACYPDADGDGYAARSGTVASSDLDCADAGEAGASASRSDCSDSDATRYPGATETVDDGVDSDCNYAELCYVDADNDGHRATTGTVSSSDTDCRDSGEGASTDPADDCNDGSASIYPGATETTGDEVDADCDGTERCYADDDDDGYLVASPGTTASADTDCDDAGEAGSADPRTDCDDGAAAVHPGATETPGDAVDGDCDGTERCYEDSDRDGYGKSLAVTSADLDCADPGEATAATDCNDADAGMSPGATEVCDAANIDEDCDLYADDYDSSVDLSAGTSFYPDLDRDGHGAGAARIACDLLAGYSASADDCDDSDGTVRPGAAESAGDRVDSDCDGAETCYVDADTDGQRGTDGATLTGGTLTCAAPGEAAASVPATDCDDTDASIYLGAPELVADGVDQDCSGGDVCHVDSDGDTYGTADTRTSADLDCMDSGESPSADDCDDGSASVNPGAAEIVGDELDSDCDGVERCAVDADGDGYAAIGETVDSSNTRCTDAGEASASAGTGDCDDGDGTVNPGATELVADGVDSDCDLGELCFGDGDGDGVGTSGEAVSADTDCADAGESARDDDCDDTVAAVSPLAEETVADNVDEDCDGAELCWADADHDGFGAADGSTVSSSDLDCEDPGEYGQAPTDCDDLAEAAHPGGTEVAGNAIDEDCDGEAVGAPETPADDTGEDPDAPDAGDDSGEGCGCATGGSDGGALGLALLAGLAARRRRRA